ncbi:GNAT superfamily N-acetyltransferase [Paenibacillus shirakamiensis]|uniref:GNAT superfamily N-acetyltransferase n=1 Tax=Paenibacillus shirakamiensis TaxID=1265935 RepID=A0ABS4JMA6_9BACL|nr:GNAT family N-acetyltransferase [Paenibacillus shirakamiensis]MBP2002246.1 GNAT superfamily N-acetyltransferase [Paenibacillus shirakamiensis]
MIHIRSYEAQDLTALTSLMGDLGYPTDVDTMAKRMDTITKLPLYYTFMAVLDHEVVGMMGLRLVYYHEGDQVTAQISTLVTKAEVQGRGVGKALVHFAEHWAKEQGSRDIYLNSGTKPEREAAHQFYKAMGYEINGYRFAKKLD